MLSESEGESDSNSDVQETVPEPGPDVKGLALAEHYFGPLLSPVPATEAQWTAYTQLRRSTNADNQNLFSRPKRSISDCVAVTEADLALDEGTLQKCVSIISRWVEWDDEEPRDSDIAVRIFSPAAAKVIDVHIKYYCRARYDSVDWFYSIGYKISHRVSSKTPYKNPSTNTPIDQRHTRHGWHPICWGYYDDSDQDNLKHWRRIEEAGMGLYEEGVLDIYETLFGPIQAPPDNDNDAILEYRRKLVASVRFLLAAVGVQYTVACTDEEEDERPPEYMLEGLSDKWVARGIRKACGFQLSRDPDEEKRGLEVRAEYAAGVDDEDEDEDDEDEDEYGEDEDEYSDDGYGAL